jgi:hypothetical protein
MKTRKSIDRALVYTACGLIAWLLWLDAQASCLPGHYACVQHEAEQDKKLDYIRDEQTEQLRMLRRELETEQFERDALDAQIERQRPELPEPGPVEQTRDYFLTDPDEED